MQGRLKLLLAAGLAASVVVIGGWDCGSVLEDRGEIGGRVLNALDGTPVAGAVVRIGKEAGMTDAEGKYVVDDIETGRQQLSVTAVGYVFPGAPMFISVSDGRRDLADLGLIPASQAPPATPGL